MTTITFPEHLWSTAETWERRLLANLPRRKNYTKLEAAHRYSAGFVGEMAFQCLLILRGKRNSYKVRLDGKSDSTDFYVWKASDGKLRTINVKTATQPTHRFMMIPDAQFLKHKQSAYVAVRIDGRTEASIHGWASRQDLQRCEPEQARILTRSIAFTDLRDIESLLEALADEQPPKNELYNEAQAALL